MHRAELRKKIPRRTGRLEWRTHRLSLGQRDPSAHPMSLALRTRRNDPHDAPMFLDQEKRSPDYLSDRLTGRPSAFLMRMSSAIA